MLRDELTSSLGGSTLSIEANVNTVIDAFPPSDSVMFISTDELKSALKVLLKVVLFNRIEGVSMLNVSLIRRCVIVSRDCNNLELTLSAGGLLLLDDGLVLLSLRFIVAHESLAVVRTPTVNRTSSIEAALIMIFVNEDVLAILLRMSTMAVMVAIDAVISVVELLATLLSSFKNAGSELLFKNSDCSSRFWTG